MRPASPLLLIALGVLALAGSARGEDPVTPTPVPFASERFDCENAFDLIALTVVVRCNTYQAPPEAEQRIAAASARLRDTGLATRAEFERTDIAFCPLATGTGMVPAPRRLYLDDGLIGLSTDGLAEILAHELEHVVQFERLGTRNFKCEYVRDMFACGGCQDRGHALEAEAYRRQDRVRAGLLQAGTDPEPAP